jgi:acyl transferase domain-containing protein
MQVNSHVSGILQTQTALGERPRWISRQHGPAARPVLDTQSMQAAGVSAFAFQGTNAHAVLCRSADATPAMTVNAHLPWQKRRFWCAVQHPFPITISEVLWSSGNVNQDETQIACKGF